jgi:hypothetical protein
MSPILYAPQVVKAAERNEIDGGVVYRGLCSFRFVLLRYGPMFLFFHLYLSICYNGLEGQCC